MDKKSQKKEVQWGIQNLLTLCDVALKVSNKGFPKKWSKDCKKPSKAKAKFLDPYKECPSEKPRRKYVKKREMIENSKKLDHCSTKKRGRKKKYVKKSEVCQNENGIKSTRIRGNTQILDKVESDSAQKEASLISTNAMGSTEIESDLSKEQGKPLSNKHEEHEANIDKASTQEASVLSNESISLIEETNSENVLEMQSNSKRKHERTTNQYSKKCMQHKKLKLDSEPEEIFCLFCGAPDVLHSHILLDKENKIMVCPSCAGVSRSRHPTKKRNEDSKQEGNQVCEINNSWFGEID